MSEAVAALTERKERRESRMGLVVSTRGCVVSTSSLRFLRPKPKKAWVDVRLSRLTVVEGVGEKGSAVWNEASNRAATKVVLWFMMSLRFQAI